MSTYGTPQPREVVTGEAVALELRLAQLPTRSLSIMLDMTHPAHACCSGWSSCSAIGGGSLDDAAGAAAALVVIVGVIVGYPLVFETLTRGKTPGKYALGLRAVRDDGGAIRFRHALVRALLEVVEIWLLLGIPAVFCSLANSRGKRFGDLAAGTVVVRERVPSKAGARADMPPELASWASTADVGRVPDDLALAARQFLVRAPQLTPEVRWSMGQRLAADVVPWLAPPPPRVPPERLLAAVVAERRRRDEHRMATQAAAARAWAEGPQAPPAPPVRPASPAPPQDDPYGYGLRPAADPLPDFGVPGSFDTPSHGSGDGFSAPT